MGFPRILSKSNKIYTKLGEFCMSIDGNQFCIVCHTCQQELQTQDTFWKHIQDEHSFMHHLKREIMHQSYLDGGTQAMDVPTPPVAALVPHYKKSNERNDLGLDGNAGAHEIGEDELGHKDYTEMRVIEPSAVEVDIKVEPAVTSQLHASAMLYAQTVATTGPSANSQQVMSYASLFQGMPQMCTVLPPGSCTPMPTPMVPLMGTQEMPKHSPTATSEDGERWYICDHETCGLKFKYQSRLELHRSVHSKVRRFACELCSASFKQSCNLSTHRKKKHNLKGTKCEARF